VCVTIALKLSTLNAVIFFVLRNALCREGRLFLLGQNNIGEGRLLDRIRYLTQCV
jgi:hypothetical protein